jgi:hypothetical protein
MEAGVHALRESSALATQILELATVAMRMAGEQPITPSDGRLLLGAAFASQARGIAHGKPSFDEPS